MVRRDVLRASAVIQQKAEKNPKVEFVFNTSVTAIEGDGNQVVSVKTKNNVTGATGEMQADGVFIYVGSVPMTGYLKPLGVLDDAGWVKTDEKMATKVPGLYAIGDVRETLLRQIATAVGDGAIAGQQVFKYVDSLK